MFRCLGRYFERYLSKPIPFLVLEIADLTRAEKDSSESRMIPKCLCSSTFFTGMLLKQRMINFNFLLRFEQLLTRLSFCSDLIA